jgi:molybdate transport system substrate-binding protein
MIRRILHVLVLAGAGLGAAPAAPHDVVVSAAASLTDVVREIAEAYERGTGQHIAVNVAASNTLARQIAAGAPVDLFISADEAQMTAVADAIVPGTRIDLLRNTLAVAVPDDRPRTMTSIRGLLDPSIRRIAIGDPAAVPAGVYAREYLQRAGVWGAVQSKLIPSGSVRLALAAVESGGADAAIVYATDVPTAHRARLAFAVPASDGPAIRYPAAVIRTGHNIDGARRFLAYLRGADAARVFARAGFTMAAAVVR